MVSKTVMVELTGNVCDDCRGGAHLRCGRAVAEPRPGCLRPPCGDAPLRVHMCAVSPARAPKARASQPTAWLSRPALLRVCGAPARCVARPVRCTVVGGLRRSSSILSAPLPGAAALRLLFGLRSAPAVSLAPAGVAVPTLRARPLFIASAPLRLYFCRVRDSRPRHRPPHGGGGRANGTAAVDYSHDLPFFDRSRNDFQPGIKRGG